MWNFKGERNIEKKFMDYHMMSINEPEFTNTQVYAHRPREIQGNGNYPLIDLDYTVDQENLFERILATRYSAREPFKAKVKVDRKLMAQFAQLAMIGGDRESRTYPSGGAQYYVNIYFLFNEQLVDIDLIEQGNIMRLNSDTHKLLVKQYQPWNEISNVFIQKYLANTAQFAIALSCDMSEISGKYTDISYKLVQQEAGHIGQNIQLVANYLGLESVPLGGFYDIELSRLLRDNQTSLYAFLLG
ncbi:SagB/ThcOx family dehydrogenase [Lysinibacillus irui]|uniref:SagB/ThcOx family dehydrogenase n=2 Tax=Lysinibacillus irui TaxID=2998077 RepID=A0AAJ5UTU0_9BACI|nr:MULTISPECIES: SagB/ThcOx family dehydrogenase [Lysinibacillus]MEA0555171.1 SagB/ThcOx family dehydrogenase [Lysinibacillus irui]MEA0565067.1 SagB/ThcOx family dehydrogenase [Lysinibacillus irui]MEA0976886.1 SagB/ThcOx family dehydrogenase [Lysinibacillus irui]MEA1043040.1 SagB/ThcOx family dehydrogenase [Lysinibacillus irui]WDV05787.1 SagB/ThcOx family dehydrogenase [Lysinibacillus irui]